MTAGVIDTRNFGKSYENSRRRIARLEQQISNPDIILGSTPAGSDGEFDEITILNPGVGSDLVINFNTTTPTGLSALTSTYLDEVYIDASWTTVGDAATEYEVEIARRTSPGVYDNPRVYRTSGTSVRMIVPLGGVVYGIRIASINRLGIRSDFSTRIDVTTAVDGTIPGTITGLSVTAAINSLVVSFDRLADSDMQNGDGLYRVQLSSNDFAAVISDKFTSSNVEGFTGLTQGTNYKVRVAGIDPSGNQGPWTTSSNVAPGSVVTGHVASGAITTTELGPGAVTAAKITAGTITGTEIAGNTITGAKILAGSVDGDRITANTLSAAAIETSTLTAADITLAGGSLVAGTPVTGDGTLLNSQGFKLYKDGQVTVNLDALTGDASFTGNLVGSKIYGGQILSANIFGEGTGETIVSNSDFNVNTTGWTVISTSGPGAFQRVASPASPLNTETGQEPYGRLYSTTGASASIYIESSAFAVEDDELYDFSCRFRGVGNTSGGTATYFEVHAYFYNSSSTLVGSKRLFLRNVANSTTLGSIKLNGNFTPQATAVTAKLQVKASAIREGSHVFDDMYVAKTPRMTGLQIKTRNEEFSSIVLQTLMETNGGAIETAGHSIIFEEAVDNAIGWTLPSKIVAYTLYNDLAPLNTRHRLEIYGGDYSGSGGARILMHSSTPVGSSSPIPSEMWIQAGKVQINGGYSGTYPLITLASTGDFDLWGKDQRSQIITRGTDDSIAMLSTNFSTASSQIKLTPGTVAVTSNTGAFTHNASVVKTAAENTAWTDVTFQFGAANFGMGWNNVQYRKIGDMVYLRGLSTGVPSPPYPFILPVGFRPPAHVLFSVVMSDAFGRVEIQPDGAAHLTIGNPASFCSYNEVSFSTIA